MPKQKKKLPSPPKDKATQAIVGQLGTISDNLQKQLTRQGRVIDKQTSRILRGMQRTTQEGTSFQQAIAARAAAEGRSLAEPQVATKRVKATKTGAKFAKTSAQAATKKAKGVTKAAKTAQEQAVKTAGKVQKGSMTLLEVLAAQREAEFQHDLMMQQLQFDQSVAMAKLQNNLQKEYQTWLFDNDYQLTPDEEAALQWKYDKKRETLSFKMAEKEAEREGNKELFQRFNIQQDTMTDAIVASAEAMSNQGLRNLGRRYVAEGKASSLRDFLVEHVSNRVARNVPEGTELSGINEFVEATFEKMSQGERAPTWSDVKNYIGMSDPTGQMQEYIDSHANKLERLHNDYKAIRTAQEIGSAPYPTPGETPAAAGGGGGLGGVAETAAAAAAVGTGVSLVRTARPLREGGGGAMLEPTASAGPGSARRLSPYQRMAAQGIDDLDEFLRQPGRIRQAIRSGLGRMGYANPFGTASGLTAIADVGMGVLRNLDPAAHSQITGAPFTDSRGVTFKYDANRGGYLIDVDSAMEHWNELTDEEKKFVGEHNKTFGTV